MKLQYILFLLFLGTVTLTYAEADEPTENLKRYDIEIIIFEDAHARYINSESWNKDTSSPDDLTKENSHISEGESVSETDEKTAAFESIKPEILNKQYKRINNSSEFNVLLYAAWQQTGLSESEAFEIDINELDNVHKKKSENTITGNVKIVLARYLHFYDQLQYHRKKNLETTSDILPANTDSNNPISDEDQNSELTADNNTYTIQSHRRMRSKELHYIDHPLVGILVQINPVEVQPVSQESGEL